MLFPLTHTHVRNIVCSFVYTHQSQRRGRKERERDKRKRRKNLGAGEEAENAWLLGPNRTTIICTQQPTTHHHNNFFQQNAPRQPRRVLRPRGAAAAVPRGGAAGPLHTVARDEPGARRPHAARLCGRAQGRLAPVPPRQVARQPRAVRPAGRRAGHLPRGARVRRGRGAPAVRERAVARGAGRVVREDRRRHWELEDAAAGLCTVRHRGGGYAVSYPFGPDCFPRR